MRYVVPLFVILAAQFLSVAQAETRWFKTPAGVDDLTGEKTAANVGAFDDARTEQLASTLLLTRDEKGKLIAVIGLCQLDRFPPGRDEVSVSYRADGDELQKETKWKREGMRVIYREISADEARAMFAGKFLVVSIDQTGKRYRYTFDDDEADKLREAVDALVKDGAG